MSPAQAAWVRARIDQPRLVQDMSWGLIASIVLHVRGSSRDVVVKAGDETNHHIGREIAAHDGWTQSLVATGHAARLIDADPHQHILLLQYLPGALVEGTDAEALPDTYAQAGALLRRLHEQARRTDVGYEARGNARAITWLDGEHRVDPPAAARARDILTADPAPPVSVVPTHGDWQPRNWLIDRGAVRIIDLGRFAFRPPATDLVHLAAGQWRGEPELEAAFFEGYGVDPRDPDRLRMETLRQAVGTACWAFQVRDEAFEQRGHRMLAEALNAF